MTLLGYLAPLPAIADPVLEEVLVRAQRNLLGQELAGGNTQLSVTADDQVSLNRTVGDWIERLPGVSLNGQGGLLQSYSLRGFSRWRIRTEVDGVPIITDRRAGNSASFVPTDLLQVSDVGLGPASSLYGSGAMGGVVGLSTTNPGGRHLSMSGQTNDNGLVATVGAGSQERSAMVSYRQANDAQDARGNTLNTGYEQIGAALKATTDIRGLTVDLGWLPSYGKDIGKSNADFPDSGRSDYPEELHSILNVKIEQDGQWFAQLYHHFQDWQSRTEQFDVRSNETDYRAHTLGGLFYGATQLGSGTGRYGVEWIGRRGVSIRDNEYTPEGQLVLSNQTIDGDSDNLGAFVDQQWWVGPVNVGGGLRFDYIDQSDRDRQRTEGQVTGNLSLAWQPSDAWELSAGAGTGFRFPSLTELYFTGVTPRGDTVGNPELEPEETHSLQLGARYAQGGLRLSLDTYVNDLENYIERFRLSPTLRSYRNLDDASIWGYEVSLDWDSSSHWQHGLSYQWQRGEDDDGNWLADLNPPGLRYLLVWQRDRLRLSSDLLYREARDEFGEGEQALDEALVWNAAGRYSFNQALDLEVYMTNLLDEHYLGTADEQAAFQPGRTVGIRVMWRES